MRAAKMVNPPMDKENAHEMAERITHYLPDNFGVTVLAGTDRPGYEVVVVGEDFAGWTLNGYVLPRLASGLIFMEEVSA